MNILTLALDQIDAGRRLRPVDPDYVTLLAASISERGQMTPIEVMKAAKGTKQPYMLVAGAHRMAAAAAAGLSEIAAVVFTGTELEAQLREIDENLVRHELKELDRSIFLARRKELYEKLHPEAKHGGSRDGQVAKFGHLTERFTKQAADRLGFSERSVRRAILRFNAIDPAVRDMIAGLWIADHGSQLDALAKLPASVQRQVAQTLLDVPDTSSVAQALAEIEGVQAPAPDPAAEQFDAFLRLWKRMPTAVRSRVRTFVNKETV